MAKADRATTYHQKFRKYRISGDYKKAKKYRNKYKKATGTSLRKLVGRDSASLKFLRKNKPQKKSSWARYVPRIKEAEEKLRQSIRDLKRSVAAVKENKKLFDFYVAQKK